MRGTDLASYDIPHQMAEQLYRDTGVRTSPLRGVGFTANIFAAEAFWTRSRRSAHRSRGASGSSC